MDTGSLPFAVVGDLGGPMTDPFGGLVAAGSCWTLDVAHTWDGDVLDAGEVVSVTMELVQPTLVVRVDAPFYGDPAPASDDLWLYEVVELMLLGADDSYLEIELSPHGRSLVLTLQGTRNVVRRDVLIDYRASVHGERWSGVAAVPFEWLWPGTNRLNAFAIHGTGPSRRYLAWMPTGGPRPDFHRLQRFGRFEDCRSG